ncbi:hypothetical protein EMCRGX_G030105 [Ephydatia muelleri]
MPLHVLANFGGFLCECGLVGYVSLLIMLCYFGDAFVMQYISPINLPSIRVSIRTAGRELKHDGPNKSISRDNTWGSLSQGLWFSAITSGRYPYTAHLLKLQQFLPTATDVLALARARCSFQGGSTPLCHDAWARLLHAHPDSAFSTYLINGLINGFRVGFNRRQPLGAVTKNMPSALQQQTIVAAYIDNEVTLGRLIGPLQLIVNDGIDPVLCSLSYVSINTVAAIVVSLGAGSLLAKIDIESAYRLVPVHPDDRPLLRG